MDNELAVAAVLLSAGASSLMPGVGGVGPAARLSGSLALSDSASCALAVAANAKQIEKITAKLPDVLVRPQHAGVGDRAACVSSTFHIRITAQGLEMQETGEAVWMMAQAFARDKHLHKVTTRDVVESARRLWPREQ